MSHSPYMPLNGALLISNPRKTPMPTFVNPKRRHQNWANKSAASQKRAAVRYQLRGKYRAQGGDNWANNVSLKAQYHAELETAKALPAAVWQARGGTLKGGSARSNPKRRRGSAASARVRGAGGIYLKGSNVKSRQIHAIDFLQPRRDAGQRGSYFIPKAAQFKSKSKRRTDSRGRRVVDGAQRGRRRSNVSSKNRMLPVGVKAVSEKSASLGHFFHEGGRWSGIASKPKSSGGRRGGSNIYTQFLQEVPTAGMSKTERSATYQAWKQARGNPRHPKSYYRRKHRLDDYGALALDNYGALALDNPFPFAGGVVADAGKLALTGLVGALGHAYVSPKAEDLLEKIPGASMVLDWEVPDGLPLIGGMPLTNTIVGIVTGAALIAASQVLGQKFGQPMLATYGSALGTGIAIAGPIVDYSSQDDDDDDDADVIADLNGLALDNYGGLALDNDGTFGDGMAYQLGAITSDGEDYGQCSLADAYYSGADFDLGEGQALLNGRKAFRRRYGHAPRRIASHGGRSAGASHLAGRQGHRWGWLVKMIGWANVQKLAAMPPKQRVSAIKQLRSNALESFKQIQVDAQEQVLSAPELAPLTAAGPDGVAGAYGAYGATIFGGAGL